MIIKQQTEELFPHLELIKLKRQKPQSTKIKTNKLTEAPKLVT